MQVCNLSFTEEKYLNYLWKVFKGYLFSAETIHVTDLKSFLFVHSCIKNECCALYKAHHTGLYTSRIPTKKNIVLMTQGILQAYCLKFGLPIPEFKKLVFV